MKFLDLDFRQDVTAETDRKNGDILVAELPFTPVDILANDAVSYDEVFDNWLNDQWLPKRQESLDSILK